MRIHQLSLQGISEAFRDRISVDFETLGPGLIAIVGENGAGKSTLIGSVFAALFRQLPGQKRPLYDFCTHPKPDIDMTFGVNGGRFRSLLKLDPKVRQMESYIFDHQGVALASGKKEAFAEWTSKNVGSAGGFLASIFSSQRRTGNFLSLERSQRKELFITQLLGLERLRLISATARGFADEKGKKVLVLDGEKKGILQLLASESEVRDVEALALELEALGSRLQGLEAQKGEQERRAEELQGRESERRAFEAQRQELKKRIEKSKGEITQLRNQIGEDERLLAGRDGPDGFQERERAVGEKIAHLHRQIEETLQLEASNSEAKAALRAIEADMSMKRGDLNRSRAESEELDSVPCGGQGPYAGCVKIRRAIQARQQVPLMEGEVATLELELEAQRSSLATIPVSSAQLTRQLREAERERQDVEAERKRQDEMRTAEARRAERASALERAVRDAATLDGELLGIEKELERFQGLEVEIKAVRRQAEEINGSLSQVRSDRERLIAQRAQAEQRLRQLEAARSRATVLEGELSEARIERDDFDYLAKVFGPDEIQLCEIQSAGPAVSSLVNALLEGCFENKFEVRFRTRRRKADGRGFVDDFDIEVRNKTLDRTCLVDELSGGQFVLVNEAVNLGIAIYNMRQGDGIRHETLFRDETVGALDTKNAREYVRMLRHAMDIGGFYQVIFICHAPQIWEMADRVLRVEGGKVFLDAERHGYARRE
ncbi:MAG TPA: AAA family ATPase [Candidatus Eisenbacteria bacterium]|nr:AAA family ATPase [Candidatus Eisenbacteria bacterium]